MGCSQSKNNVENGDDNMVHTMFKKFDKEGKGYISRENLQKMMTGDTTTIQRDHVDHTMTKFGTDDKMSLEQFELWWGSTYTTYNDDAALQKMVDEVNEEQSHLPQISEMDELAPHNSNVAVSRS
jgi:Ca2+-binding EF-hand superfamily protein